MPVTWKTPKPMMSTYWPPASVVATVNVIGWRWVTGWPSPFVPVARMLKR